MHEVVLWNLAATRQTAAFWGPVADMCCSLWCNADRGAGSPALAAARTDSMIFRAGMDCQSAPSHGLPVGLDQG